MYDKIHYKLKKKRKNKKKRITAKARREGTFVYLWLIHFDVWQKPTQCCKAIILQLKINSFKSCPKKKKKTLGTFFALILVLDLGS